MGSRKEPDWAIIPNTDTLPSVAAESGWSDDNWPTLIGDMELLLVGGRPNVQLVLLFNWSKQGHSRVAGELRVYEGTAAGNTSERFRSSIFFYPRGGACRRPSDPWRTLWCIWCFPKAEYSGCLGAFVGTTSRDCGADDTGQRMSTSMRNVGTDPHKSTSVLEAFIVSAFPTSSLPETTLLAHLGQYPPST